MCDALIIRWITFVTLFLSVSHVASQSESVCPWDFDTVDLCRDYNPVLGGDCHFDALEGSVTGARRCNSNARENEVCREANNDYGNICYNKCQNFHATCCCPPEIALPSSSPSLLATANPSKSTSAPTPSNDSLSKSMTIFKYTVQETKKNKKTELLIKLKLWVRDEDNKKVGDATITLDWKTRISGGSGKVSGITKNSGIVIIEFPLISIDDYLDIELTSIVKTGFKYYPDNNVSTAGCAVFSSSCNYLTVPSPPTTVAPTSSPVSNNDLCAWTGFTGDCEGYDCAFSVSNGAIWRCTLDSGVGCAKFSGLDAVCTTLCVAFHTTCCGNCI